MFYDIIIIGDNVAKSNLPVLETNRLILREIEEKDVYDMFEYASLPYVGPVAGWEPHPSISYTKSVIKNLRGGQPWEKE